MLRWHLTQMAMLSFLGVIALSTLGLSADNWNHVPPLKSVRDVVEESWNGIIRRNGHQVLPFLQSPGGPTVTQHSRRRRTSMNNEKIDGIDTGEDVDEAFEEGWPEFMLGLAEEWVHVVRKTTQNCKNTVEKYLSTHSTLEGAWDAKVKDVDIIVTEFFVDDDTQTVNEDVYIKDVCGFGHLSQLEDQLSFAIGPGEACSEVSMVILEMSGEFEDEESFTRTKAAEIFASTPTVAGWWNVPQEAAVSIFRKHLDAWLEYRTRFLHEELTYEDMDTNGNMSVIHDAAARVCKEVQTMARNEGTDVQDEYLEDFVQIMTLTAFTGLSYPHIHDRRSNHRVGWSAYELDNMQSVRRVLSIGNTHHQFVARALQHLTQSSKDDVLPFVSYVCDQTDIDARRACQTRSIVMYNNEYPIDLAAPFGEGEITLLMYDLVDIDDAYAILSQINTQGRFYLPVLNTHNLNGGQSMKEEVKNMVEQTYPHMVSLIDIDFSTRSMAVNGPGHVMARNLRAFASITPWAKAPRGRLSIDPTVPLTQGAGMVAAAAAGRHHRKEQSATDSMSKRSALLQRHKGAAMLWDQPQIANMDLPAWQDRLTDSILRNAPSHKEMNAQFVASTSLGAGNDDNSLDLSAAYNGQCSMDIGNQGECGSCWAWSVALAGEMSRCLRTKQVRHQKNDLTGESAVQADWPSVQYILNCVYPSSFACRGAYLNSVLNYLGSSSGPGMVSAKCLPYGATSCKSLRHIYGTSCDGSLETARMPRCSNYCYDGGQEDPQHYISGGRLLYRTSGRGRHFSASATAEAMKDYLDRYGPIVVGIEVYESFMTYSGGMYTPSTREMILGGHAVVVVGYGTDSRGVPYWKVQNSWSERWGEDGFFRIQRGVNAMGIESSAYGVVVIV